MRKSLLNTEKDLMEANIQKSKNRFSSSSSAKGWLLEVDGFRGEFRTQRDAKAAAKLADHLAYQGKQIGDFESEIVCYDQQGDVFEDTRRVLFEDMGRFRVISPNVDMERDEIIEATELLERIEGISIGDASEEVGIKI